ncbi:hypothetical protein BG004_008423 [Podila humilis]|nr:hypothetical protein BG004_008423 [Podila humilis]
MCLKGALVPLIPIHCPPSPHRVPVIIIYTLTAFDLSSLRDALDTSLPTMVPAARLNPPPVFTGTRDGFAALAWLLAVKRYFHVAKIPEADRTPHALSYLGTPGPARWFDGCALADTCNFETDFIPAFKKEYIPYNFAGACRRTLTNLRMTTTFPVYLDTFKELLGALLGHAATQSAKDTVNDFAQTSFIDNCPLVLQQLIEGHILQHEDITLDEIFHASSSLPPTTPMEIDSIQVTLNNINRRFHQLERNLARNNNNNNRNNNYNNHNRNHYNNNGSRNNFAINGTMLHRLREEVSVLAESVLELEMEIVEKSFQADNEDEIMVLEERSAVTKKKLEQTQQFIARLVDSRNIVSQSEVALEALQKVSDESGQMPQGKRYLKDKI